MMPGEVCVSRLAVLTPKPKSTARLKLFQKLSRSCGKAPRRRLWRWLCEPLTFGVTELVQTASVGIPQRTTNRETSYLPERNRTAGLPLLSTHGADNLVFGFETRRQDCPRH